MHTVGGGVEFVPRYRVHAGIAGRRVHVASFYIAHLRGVDQRDSRWCSTTDGSTDWLPEPGRGCDGTGSYGKRVQLDICVNIKPRSTVSVCVL